MTITTNDALDIVAAAYKGLGFNRHALPRSLQAVHLIGHLDFEVTLGGVYGWLINMGPDGPDTAEALEAVGAHQCAAIVREILSFFPDGKPPTDDRERVRQMNKASEADLTRWRDLGDRLLEWPDDIHALLQAYVTAHEEDFVKAQGDPPRQRRAD